MKNLNQRNRLIPKTSFLLLVLLLLNNLVMFSQTVTFQKNISLPEETEINNVKNFGAGILDVISANNLFFAYAGDKLIILDSDGQTIIKILEFPEKYGKYNPIIHDPNLHMPGVNLMTVFENPLAGDREDLFIVTPNLDIMLVNTNPNVLSMTLVKSIPTNLSHYRPLHGVCRIKYDSNHNRLYWLIKGVQNDPNPIHYQNCTGEFHAREVYFVIYDVDNSGNLTEYYEFNELSISGDFGHYKDINICDFEYNRDDNGGSCDYFFLAKYNRIETWKFGDDPTTTNEVEVVHRISVVNTPEGIYGYLPGNQNESAYYKFGRMLYIDELHKVLVFPYRYPGYSLVDPVNNPPFIYIIDGFTTEACSIPTPNQRIYDAKYITTPTTQHLAICYSANPDDKIVSSDPDSDIATSSYDISSQSFSPFTTLSSNTNPAIPGIDVNSSSHLTSVNGQILISKKDEVLRLINNSGSFSVSTPLLTAKNNFFGKGASGSLSTAAVIINKVGGRIEKFTSSGTNASYISGLNTYFPAYHSVSNPMGTKVYFYNKLTHKNSGFYIYEPDETTPELTHIDNFESPLGDCIFNKFRGEFLLSQNEDFGSSTSAAIVRFNNNNEIEGEIDLMEVEGPEVYYQNAGKMFIDPNGVLYVLVNSVVGDINPPSNEFPYILTYNANTYDFIKSYELNDFTSTDIINTSEYYMAHFCYSKSNNTTYFTVTPQDISLPPYHSEYNTMYNSWDEGYTPNNGYLFSIKDETLTREYSGNSIIHPGKIICPDDGNDNTQSINEDKLFILSDIIRTYIYSTKEMESYNQRVNDISYSPYHDKVFAFVDKGLDDDCDEDRTAVIYQITGTFPITFEQIVNGTYSGQVSSFFLNPYNNKLYLQTKFDNIKLGASPAKLIEFDIEPGSSTATKTEINLNNNTYTQNKSFYPELDHCPDYRYFTCNLTTPTIDPYRNIMYLPNGGFSNVSVVEFTPEETLTLNGLIPHKASTWLSIPRHQRPDNNTTPIETVFHTNNISGNLTRIEIEYNNILESDPQGYENFISSIWDIGSTPNWVKDPDNTVIYSTRGYVVEHLPDEQKTLTLKGTVETPEAGIDLYCKKDNWIGYFLYEEQSVFDALAEILDQIYHIQGQTYDCYRYNYPVSNVCGSKSSKDYTPGTWICNDRPNIKYGDMIMVKPDPEYTITNFQWSYLGNPPSDLIVPEVEYFEYEEKATYTTFVIELDTTNSNPNEIGAFVNDTCIGACSVNDQDSVVVLSAYLGDNPGDSVTFENYYSTSKSTTVIVNDYLVLNNETYKKERRVVKTGGKQNVYIISFRNEPYEEVMNLGNNFDINIYPNPATSMVHIEYTLPEESSVRIEVLDVLGKRVAHVLNKSQSEGVYSTIWNIARTSNLRIEKGVYFIEIKIDEEMFVRKVMVN